MTQGNRSSLEGWIGATYQDILDLDKRVVPTILREKVVRDLGSEPLKASRYTDPAFFANEAKYVWLRTWQFACREEDVPSPGDVHVYDLLDHSIIIVRQSDHSLKAFRNICRHRGRRLVDQGGCLGTLSCKYHGFTWNMDGSFTDHPSLWDFPEIDGGNFSLLGVNIESWAGFVFVNLDRHAPPLMDVLKPLTRHFEHWHIEKCYKSAHVGKTVPANWKVAAEAFLENHHVGSTHPQLASYTNDANAQYDVLSDHVTRAMSATGTPGILYRGPDLNEDLIIQHMLSAGTRAGKGRGLGATEGETARNYIARLARLTLHDETGMNTDKLSDAEMVDAISYDLFPNFHLWGGFINKICYRFRPDPQDHEKTFMEVMLFKLAPVEEPCPEPAKLHVLRDDEPWSNALELGYLSGVYDQDESNMPAIQAGLKDLGEGTIHFGRYSEVRCRNLHRMIDEYIERGKAQDASD